MFFYRNYSHSVKATLTNAFIRLIGFFAIVAALFIAVEDFTNNIILIAVLVIFGIFIFFLSNIASERIANKSLLKIQSKSSSLIPTIIKEGEEVLDITEDILNPPATIIFHRDKAFAACLVPIKYIFNGKEFCKLKNNEKISVSTSMSVNTFTTVRHHKDFDDISLIKVVVRPGENIAIHYKGFEFSEIERN